MMSLMVLALSMTCVILCMLSTFKGPDYYLNLPSDKRSYVISVESAIYSKDYAMAVTLLVHEAKHPLEDLPVKNWRRVLAQHLREYNEVHKRRSAMIELEDLLKK